MYTADHPQIDGQTERVNRAIEDILRSVCANTLTRFSLMLPGVEFAINNSVHASTGYTTFYVIGLTHPRIQITLPLRGSGLVGERSLTRSMTVLLIPALYCSQTG